MLLYNCKFPYRLMLKNTKLNLKYKKSKNYHEKGTTLWYIFTSLLLKSLKQCLIDITSLRHSKLLYSQSILFKCNSNYDCVFTNCLDHKIYKTKVLTHIPPHSYMFFSCVTWKFSFVAQNAPFVCRCSHVITLVVSFEVQE